MKRPNCLKRLAVGDEMLKEIDVKLDEAEALVKDFERGIAWQEIDVRR